MTYTYQQLRTRIAELVSDIKKLEFGCEVKFKTGSPKGRVVQLECEDKVDSVNILIDDSYCDWFNVEDIEILGRDPSLADVLRATGKLNEILYIDAYGNFLDYKIIDDELLLNSHRWDLSKPLSGQSQRTLDFIGELIK